MFATCVACNMYIGNLHTFIWTCAYIHSYKPVPTYIHMNLYIRMKLCLHTFTWTCAYIHRRRTTCAWVTVSQGESWWVMVHMNVWSLMSTSCAQAMYVGEVHESGYLYVNAKESWYMYHDSFSYTLPTPSCVCVWVCECTHLWMSHGTCVWMRTSHGTHYFGLNSTCFVFGFHHSVLSLHAHSHNTHAQTHKHTHTHIHICMHIYMCKSEACRWRYRCKCEIFVNLGAKSVAWQMLMLFFPPFFFHSFFPGKCEWK